MYQKSDSFDRFQALLRQMYQDPNNQETTIFRKVCPCCGSVFYSTDQKRRKYCSDDCRMEAARKKNVLRKPIRRTRKTSQNQNNDV